MAKQFQHADRRNIPFAVIAGEKEMEANNYALKNLSTGEQVQVSFEELKAALL